MGMEMRTRLKNPVIMAFLDRFSSVALRCAVGDKVRLMRVMD